jgi:hypothetical protein
MVESGITTRGLAMRIPWPLIRQILLTVFAIYLIGGAVMFSVQLFENLDLAAPITVGGAALLVAALAKLIVREDFKGAPATSAAKPLEHKIARSLV